MTKTQECEMYIMNRSNWMYRKPLAVKSAAVDFGKAFNCRFPKMFYLCVDFCNGARPSKRIFTSGTEETEHELKSFLSFNTDDKESAWKINRDCVEYLADRYMAFAIDYFGNLICFDKYNNYCIVFIDIDRGWGTVEDIAPDFTSFILMLKEEDEYFTV